MTEERARVTKLEDKIDNLSDRITTLQMDLIETRYAVKSMKLLTRDYVSRKTSISI